MRIVKLFGQFPQELTFAYVVFNKINYTGQKLLISSGETLVQGCSRTETNE
jgi:hypothetical protein